MYAHQDWQTVVLKKPAQAATQKHVHNEHAHRARKLEADISVPATEEAPPVAPLSTLSHTMRQAMIAARTSQKLTQQDLANRCNIQVAIIKALEGGQVIQDKSILNKVNRVLCTKLRFDQ